MTLDYWQVWTNELLAIFNQQRQTMTHNNRGKRRTNPLPETVRAARLAAGLTLEQAGKVLHTSGRVFGQWETSADNVSARRMHPGLWELFLIKTGLINRPEFDPDYD